MKKNGNVVYIVSLVISLVISIYAIVFPEHFSRISNAVFCFLTESFSWFYQLVMFGFVVFVLCVAFSKYGNIRLGRDDSKPDYSVFSWFAMLFCAGMGVGLVFWGISEPVSHYVNPVAGIEPGTAEAADFAMRASFMHWGIHPWANYAVVGLALAYFQYRKGRPGLMSSALTGILGGNTSGWIGKATDILAAFASIAGIVTSLGLGVLQINSGFHKMFGIPDTLMVQIIIIAIVTAIFMASAISGIDRGVKILSNMNVYLAITLMAGTFLVGPKIEIFSNLVNGIGGYINGFLQDSLSISPYAKTAQWIKAWRIFYWAWWIAWAPFVGLFIARISKGRTIREFVLGVVGAPTLASVIWFAIFGSMGIHLGQNGTMGQGEMQEIAAAPESGVFSVLSHYQFGTILSVIALVLLLIFFVTSADSGTFVLAMLSSEGNMNPPRAKKIVWSLLQSFMSIGLLVSGGLKPLQTISIVAAFPFAFVMIGACISLVKALGEEGVMEQAVSAAETPEGGLKT